MREAAGLEEPAGLRESADVREADDEVDVEVGVEGITGPAGEETDVAVAAGESPNGS